MKNPIRGHFLAALAAALGLILAACSTFHGNTVVGKWNVSQTGKDGGDGMVTFYKDGKVVDENGGQLDNGEYSVTSSNTLNLKMKGITFEYAIFFDSPDKIQITPKRAGGMLLPASTPAATLIRVSQ